MEKMNSNILVDIDKNAEKIEQELDKVLFKKENEHNYAIEENAFQEITPLNLI